MEKTGGIKPLINSHTNKELDNWTRKIGNGQIKMQGSIATFIDSYPADVSNEDQT